MNNQKLRGVLTLIGKIILLCIIWNFALKDDTGTYYIYTFVYKIFTIYIPLIIATIGILLSAVTTFINNRAEERMIRLCSIAIVLVAFLFSIITFFTIGTSSAKEETIKKKTASENKYQVENFTITPKLSDDMEIRATGSTTFSLGTYFAYYTNQRYVSEDDSLFHLEMNAYELEDIPNGCTNVLSKYLEKNYFKNPTAIEEYDGKKYMYYYEEGDNQARKYSYFLIFVQNGNNISLLELSCFYVNDYHVNISSIIDKLCSTGGSTGDGTVCD